MCDFFRQMQPLIRRHRIRLLQSKRKQVWAATPSSITRFPAWSARMGA